jgi:hypothetical protein
MKNTFKFATLNLSSGSNIQLHAPWSGGRGWINVTGTFVGATAGLNVSLTTNTDVGFAGEIGLPVPGIPSFITAAGLYPFESPKGGLAINVQAIGAGDSVALTELGIIDVNPFSE